MVWKLPRPPWCWGLWTQGLEYAKRTFYPWATVTSALTLKLLIFNSFVKKYVYEIDQISIRLEIIKKQKTELSCASPSAFELDVCDPNRWLKARGGISGATWRLRGRQARSVKGNQLLMVRACVVAVLKLIFLQNACGPGGLLVLLSHLLFQNYLSLRGTHPSSSGC